LNRGRQLCSAGRPSGWALAHILVSGVVQGSGIGPLMFLVYINELIELLDKISVKVKHFTDDVKIYVRIVNDIDSDVLQRALDSLQQWTNMWQLILSVNKCCVLNIGNPRLAVNVNIGNSALPWQQCPWHNCN